jgi:hypothetical protein
MNQKTAIKKDSVAGCALYAKPESSWHLNLREKVFFYFLSNTFSIKNFVLRIKPLYDL